MTEECTGDKSFCKNNLESEDEEKEYNNKDRQMERADKQTHFNKQSSKRQKKC